TTQRGLSPHPTPTNPESQLVGPNRRQHSYRSRHAPRPPRTTTTHSDQHSCRSQHAPQHLEDGSESSRPYTLGLGIPERLEGGSAFRGGWTSHTHLVDLGGSESSRHYTLRFGVPGRLSAAGSARGWGGLDTAARALSDVGASSAEIYERARCHHLGGSQASVAC